MDDAHKKLTVITANQNTINPHDLGSRVKAVRKQRNWTLDEASLHTGLAKSTLSKIENNKVSPTFDVIRKLTEGLGIDIPQLFLNSSTKQSSCGRRAYTQKGKGRPYVTATYEHELLATELTHKRMIPYKTIIRARSFDAFGDWIRHSGEEFLYILSGSLMFYSEYYEPTLLAEGDSLYYDSDMGHACISISPEDAVVLWVSTTLSY